MNELIVSCAGCGKRFKGVPGAKKFRCSGCQNLFTYPDSPREAGFGKTICSCCWMETDWNEALSACPGCSQKISPTHGGRAILWAAGSSLAPSIPQAEQAKSSGNVTEVDARVADLMTQLAIAQAAQNQLQSDLAAARAEAEAKMQSMRNHLEAAHREADERNSLMLKARSELEEYRTLAVAALEPLSLEYTHRMREMIAESDKLRASLREAREDLTHRLDRVESSGAELREKLSNTCREINLRLSQVLGVEPDRGEVLENPMTLPKGPLSELLAAGVPITGSAIVVTRHNKA